MISETKQVVEKKNIVLENKLHNRFDIEVRDSQTGEVRQKAQAFNIILDQFWTRLFANQSVYDYIQYGSGQGTPSASDTALFNWVGGAAASAAVFDDAHYVDGWNSFTRSIVLDEQTAVGVTLTEVGIAGATNSALCTHAMLQDMNGNPISIQKTNTDIITIYATVYIHWNVNGSNGFIYNPKGHWFGTYFYYTLNIFALKSLNLCNYAGMGSGYGTYQLQGDAATKTWTWPAMRLSADLASANSQHGIYALVFSSRSDPVVENSQGVLCMLDVRDEYSITDEVVGTGDGVTSEFYTAFDSPYDISVYVDGVLSTGTSLGFHSTRAYSPTILESNSTDSNHCVRFGFTALGTVGDTALYYIDNYLDNPPIYIYVDGMAGVADMEGSYSDDTVTWSTPVPISNRGMGRAIPVPSDFYGKKYIKLTCMYASYSSIILYAPHKNKIVFQTPPAAGAVITASYKTPFVPKDANHVYDFSLTIQLGEYNNP